VTDPREIPENNDGPILLFDIDGTLIMSGGAGARALEQAFVELTGIERALSGVHLDGATDLAIVREALEHGGRQVTPELMDQLVSRYTALLPGELQRAEGYRLLEGVEALLEKLAAELRIFGLCTGNVREGARAKLARGGVWEHFTRTFEGGFGSDGEVRSDIVRAALRRADTHRGHALKPMEALVIGDTPRDVQAAHEVGVPVLAVATGRYTAAQLREAGADLVVDSLAEPAALEIMCVTA
jgi:phosphoglycolate phosphatase